MKYLLILAISIFICDFISCKPDKAKLPPSVKVSSSRIDVEIDASDKIGVFNENVIYNLQFSDNELKSVNLEKILPQIESDFFDVKVTSNDVKILKYEVKEVDAGNDNSNSNNFNKKVKNKVLVITFEDNEGDKNNFNQGAVSIEYSYKVKDITSTVKDTYYFKDINFYEEFSTSSYSTKFTVNIKNLPENVKIKNLEFDNTPEMKVENISGVSRNETNNNTKGGNKISFEFEQKSEGGTQVMKVNSNSNENNSNKKLKKKKNQRNEAFKYTNKFKTLHFEVESQVKNSNLKLSGGEDNFKRQTNSWTTESNSYSSFAQVNSNYNTNNNGNSGQKSYVYYTKKKNKNNSNNSSMDIWESMVAILMTICICYLCCNCFSSNSTDSAHAQKNDGNMDHNGNPDGYVYYCN